MTISPLPIIIKIRGVKDMSTKRNSTSEISKLRNYKVVKSNELIQQRTHLLTLQEQKIILCLISQLKAEQTEFETLIFDIVDFCEICGIDQDNGKNYINLKKTIKTLSDKSMWLMDDKKNETLVRWISKAKIQHKNGKIEIEFDKDMAPFLLQLKTRYTQFDLIYTLGMKSKYSIRLYEVLKSYQKKNEIIHFDLNRFQKLVGSEYERWVDVRRFVIEPAVKEINKLTDLWVEYEAIKKGRAVAYIDFEIIEKKNISDKIETKKNIYKSLDGKINEDN